MIKPLLISTLLALSPALAQAQEAKPTPLAQMPAGAYTLDKTHASLTWKVSHMGMSKYTARFAALDAKLNFNPQDITKSTVRVTVDPASVTTDYPDAQKTDFDAELAKGTNWFNAGKFPEITFESTKLEKTSETTGKLTGNLTFLGVTKPLTLDVTFNGGYEKMPMMNIPAMGFSATGTLKRSNWGLTSYVPMIGDDVELLIETEFHKAQ
ncbi:MAG: polyisoprenoid-binding protein [Proteobacteria bacterium]|nr:polyisoprenoid-binding protein [Pseudomonadota bacterium]